MMFDTINLKYKNSNKYCLQKYENIIDIESPWLEKSSLPLN